jgi:hypothetical protein
MILNKVKLIYDFFRLWIKWRDCKEAWEDAKFINDKEIQRELGEEQILPCNFDHNGECLICDCWVSDCAYLRYLNGDYKWETREELEEMFKKSKIMNKEQQELLDESYKNFEKWYNEHSGKEDYTGYFVPDKEEFIRLIKTDDLFSEKWGLTIEERELSTDERKSIYEKEYVDGMEVSNNNWLNSKLTTRNVPTKLITIKYNNKKIESYE